VPNSVYLDPLVYVFVKLLALFSNVFASFSVFLCCSSLPSICGLKGGIKQSVHKMPASAIEPSKEDRAHLHMSMQSQDRAQEPQSSACHISRISRVALAIALLPLQRCGLLEQLCVLECTNYDRAHIGLRLSTPLTWQHIIFCL
jgi:hypothetical protein